jgi:hypothetical protein
MNRSGGAGGSGPAPGVSVNELLIRPAGQEF